MTDACQRTLEDPEANAAHLAECEECRALFDTLGLVVDEQPIAVDALPLASWEGASHRAWPLVAGGVALIGIAVALCIALGAHPVEILQRALVPTVDTYGLIAGYAEALRQASIAWQIGFGVLFVAVNAALVLLLRRAPKGIDA